MHVVVRVDVGACTLVGREIESLSLDEALGQHSFCRFEFHRDPSHPAGAAAALRGPELLNAPVKLTLIDDDGEVVAFSGRVRWFREDHLPNGGSRFTAEAVSASWRWEMHRQQKSYRNHTLADLLGALEVSASGELPASGDLNYVQNGETNWDFARRVASEHGLLVRATESGMEVRAGFADITHPLTWGENLVSLQSAAEAVNHGVKGAAYDSRSKHDHRFQGVRQSPSWLGGAGELVAAVENSALSVAGGGDPHVVGFTTRSPTLAAFRKRLERSSETRLGTGVAISGSSNSIRLKPGDRAEVVANHDWETGLSGLFGLTAVLHIWNGQLYENRFSATPWAGFAPPYPTLQDTVGIPGLTAGVVVALVVDNADTAGMGRIRVRYPWQDEDEKSGWTRVAAPYAGNGRGVGLIPEIGDEVLMAFDQGDIERPYVLGSLWNGMDLAAHTPDTKQVVTRSGNTVRLVDTEGSELVEMFSATGKCMVQLNNSLNGQPTITLHSEGDMSLEAPNGQVRITCKDLLTVVSGDASQDVKGSVTERVGGSITISSTGSLTLAANGAASLVAGQTLVTHAGAMNLVSGSVVQLNPPGAAAPAVNVQVPEAPASCWRMTAVPTAAAGLSTESPAAAPAPPSAPPAAPAVAPAEGAAPAISARADGRNVVVARADGTEELRSGGSRAWRNNNPGNIRSGAFANANGAIGEAGGFAVFPDADTGRRAVGALLRAPSYRNLSINDAVARYAPPVENDTTNYQRLLSRSTGLSGDTPMSSLTDAQLDSVVGAIQQIEGWTPGVSEIRQ